jgi:hypothetical protein
MPHRALLSVALSLAVGLAAAPLLATDGVIQISQAAIEAAGGFPHDITAPGSYRLTGNLTVTQADAQAILVDANDVTIDLNGFTIRGPASGNGDGIFSAGVRLTVRNGTIVNFGRHGILSGSLRAEKLTLSSNGGSGIVCDAGHLSDVIIDGNQSDGVVISQGLVSGCLIRGNGLFGLNGDRVPPGGSSIVGYHHNFFDSNNSGNVKSGVNLGDNLCGTAACP